MRISSDPKSLFFWRNIFTYAPTITLDGLEIDEVVEADSDAGYIIVIDTDSAGNPRYAGGMFLTKTLTGTVIIAEGKAE